MKHQLNEIKRMQQLAGILNENQFYGDYTEESVKQMLIGAGKDPQEVNDFMNDEEGYFSWSNMTFDHQPTDEDIKDAFVDAFEEWITGGTDSLYENQYSFPSEDEIKAKSKMGDWVTVSKNGINYDINYTVSSESDDKMSFGVYPSGGSEDEEQIAEFYTYGELVNWFSNQLDENKEMEYEDIDGWMRSYIDDIVKDQQLDLDYRREFEEAFNYAIDMFKKEHGFDPSSQIDKDRFWHSF